MDLGESEFQRVWRENGWRHLTFTGANIMSDPSQPLNEDAYKSEDSPFLAPIDPAFPYLEADYLDGVPAPSLPIEETE